MADDLDLQELERGALDLAATDLEGATLTARNLQGRNFKRAKLTATDFSGSKLENTVFEGAQTSGMKAAGASFLRADFKNTAVVQINFSGSDLREASFRYSPIVNCDFSRADLRGADFRNCNFVDRSKFDEALIDEKTDFEGAQTSRPMSRDPIFRNFALVGGTLQRKPAADFEAPPNDLNASVIRDFERASDKLLSALKGIEPEGTPANQSVPGIGHNRPPAETPLERPDYDALRQAVLDAKIEIQAAQPSGNKFEAALQLSGKAALSVFSWIGSISNAGAMEFAKAAGKQAGEEAVKWAVRILLGGGLLVAINEYREALVAAAKGVLGVAIGG